jgi:hypothetical protein
MKKLILLFVVIVQMATIVQAQYVYLENGKFKLSGQNYYPMVLNYLVQIRKNSQNEYWVTPTHCYGNTNEFECHNKADCLNELKAQFQMVKDMGFNAIRLCGISPDYNSDYATNKSGKIYMTSGLLDANTPVSETKNVQEELTSTVRTKMFSFISDVLNVAADRGIKVLLLCGGPDTAIYRDKYADYLEALANNFKNSTILLGYDLFNEPTYSSKMGNSKEGLSKSQICGVVSGWINRMKAVDPNHLITVGFASSATVGDWDPELISVDFASFHPYGTSNQVGNEIYWYAKNMTKPWIIGETGLPADNIQTSYEEQKQFASIVSKRCIDCGGDGFSWWQYQDVWWAKEENGVKMEDWGNNYLGLLSHDGITATTVSGLSVQGTPKPAVDEFKNFSAYIPTYTCPMYSDYYNGSGQTKYKVSGKIVNNQNNSPINGAVVVGRDKNWVAISSTFSKSDGTFDLFYDSENPIRIVNFGNLKMDNNTCYFSLLDNSNPTSLNNITINIGQTQTYNSQNSVTTSNFAVKGDGSNGGSATINAPLYIIFNSGTKVEKGGRLSAGSMNITLTTSLRLYPLSSCSSSLKSAKITDESVALSVTQEENQSFSVYPNPTNGFLNIKSNSNQHKSIELFNAFGKLVLSKSTEDELTTLNISALSSGIYMLRVCTNKGIELKKIIRQ